MILTVIGARPQFVKAAVVSKALRQLHIPETIIHTGQHYDDKMSAVFWKELDIPEVSMNLNAGSGSQGSQTAAIIHKLEEYILSLPQLPTCLLVYGDTNSTLAASIVASKMRIPIVHVEAGLRSFNRSMPEEINRVVTDHLSSVLFCSSGESVDQLKREGITENVFLSGDVMFDAVLQFGEAANIPLSSLTSLGAGEYYLLTLHRPSNTDDRGKLELIIQRLGETGHAILWPVHPRLKATLHEMNIPRNIQLTTPFSYFEMLVVLRNCKKVITDSGGLQKEAYWLRKPCVTLRGETEWTETLHDNWNILCDENNLIAAINAAVEDITWFPLYGDGKAAMQVAGRLREIFFTA